MYIHIYKYVYTDTVRKAGELTVKSLVYLVPKLSERVINSQVLRALAQLQVSLSLSPSFALHLSCSSVHLSYAYVHTHTYSHTHTCTYTTCKLLCTAVVLLGGVYLHR